MENVSGVALPRSHSYEARDAAGSGWDCCRRARGWCCCRGVDAESWREGDGQRREELVPSLQACPQTAHVSIIRLDPPYEGLRPGTRRDRLNRASTASFSPRRTVEGWRPRPPRPSSAPRPSATRSSQAHCPSRTELLHGVRAVGGVQASCCSPTVA